MVMSLWPRFWPTLYIQLDYTWEPTFCRQSFTFVVPEISYYEQLNTNNRK